MELWMKPIRYTLVFVLVCQSLCKEEGKERSTKKFVVSLTTWRQKQRAKEEEKKKHRSFVLSLSVCLLAYFILFIIRVHVRFLGITFFGHLLDNCFVPKFKNNFENLTLIKMSKTNKNVQKWAAYAFFFTFSFFTHTYAWCMYELNLWHDDGKFIKKESSLFLSLSLSFTTFIYNTWCLQYNNIFSAKKREREREMRSLEEAKEEKRYFFFIFLGRCSFSLFFPLFRTNFAHIIILVSWR